MRRALERVPTAQVRWTIVKVNELNEPLDGEELEEGGEAQFSISLKRTNKSNSQVVSISNFPKYKEASWFLIIANAVPAVQRSYLEGLWRREQVAHAHCG